MSGSGRADNGRGNNRVHQFKRRNNSDEGQDSFQGGGNSHGNNSFRTFQKPQEKKNRVKWAEDSQNNRNVNKNPENNRSEKTPHTERPKWTPLRINTNPLPVPDCPYCGKPIRDISQAIADKDTGTPVHFDCIVSRIAGGEILEKDDTVTYIGGGRFGIVSFSGRNDFRIKKIIEWENKDKRAEWRSEVCEHYSVV